MNSRLPWSDRQTDYGHADAYDYAAGRSDRGVMAESSALHQKLNELSSQLSAMVSEDAERARSLPRSEPRRYSSPDPESSMRSLIDRIENNEISSGDSMSSLNRQLATLAEKLERDNVAPHLGRGPDQGHPATFDSAIKNVMAHVEQSEARTRSTLKALQDRIAEIGARAASSSSKGVQDTAAPIEDLERRLASITDKLDRQENTSRKDSRIESLEKKISELAESLPEPGAGQPAASAPGVVDAGTFFAADQGPVASTAQMDALEQRLEALANEVRGTMGQNLSQEDVSRLWKDQSSLAEQVRQLKASAASNRDLQSMRASLEQLTRQVNVNDDSARFDQVNQRIKELAQRLENTLPNTAELAKTSELEAKILQLDARMSAAQAQPENSVAIKALEAQVRQIADRIGEHERRLDTISELEASIAQLTSRLQTTRNEVAASAEQAASRMAEQLRAEVEHKVSKSKPTDATAELQALQQGLNAIQSNTQTSDRRTHETLIAVHDTLDSVIERMNQIEAAKAAIAADAGRPLAGMPSASTVDPLTPPAFGTAAPGAPTVAAQFDTVAAAAEPAPVETLFADAAPAEPMMAEPLQAEPLQAQPPHLEPVMAHAPGFAPGFNATAPREDFIAAARAAARAAGHSVNRAGPMAAPQDRHTPIAPQLGGQNAMAQPNTDEAGPGKRRQLVIAGAMALLIGAVAAYGLLNGYGGNSKSSAPQITRTAPAAGGGVIQSGPRPSQPQPSNTAPDQGSSTVPPAESVPFDPTAPQQNGNLDSTVPSAADQTQTASISNFNGKSDAPATSAAATLDSSVPRSPTSTLKSNPVLDPNVTSIGNTVTAPTSGAFLPLTPQSQDSRPAASNDPFVTGSISNAEPAADPDAASLSPEQSELLAGLPKALGPDAMLWAAAKGDKVAQFMVATRYSDGKAIEKNFDQAAIWYHKAASKGLAPAQYRLGTLYERGRGVQKDINSAKAWYEHAAHRGHIKAMHNLAVLHANSPGGKTKFNQAGYWFKKAASLGLKDSQYNLAILYEEGLGVQKDLVEAYRWYTLAAKQKDKDAAKRLAKIKTMLQPDDLAQAKQLVETWRPMKAKFAANVVTPPIGGWQQPEAVEVRGTTQELGGFRLGQATKEAQRLLNAIGYDAGTPDGQMGPRTATAIKQFQAQHGKQPTGKVTPELLEQLRNLPG